jgi:hypothetical protein
VPIGARVSFLRGALPLTGEVVAREVTEEAIELRVLTGDGLDTKLHKVIDKQVTAIHAEVFDEAP